MKQEQIQHFLRKAVLVLGYLSAVLVVVLLIAVYGFGMRDNISYSLGRVVPLPIGSVGSKFITTSEFTERLDLLEKVNRVQVTSAVRESVLDKLQFDHLVQALAEKNGVVVSESDLDSHYKFVQSVTGNPNPASQYGISEEQFKQLVLYPDILNTKLSIWLSENKSINSEAFAKLSEVNSQIAQGAKIQDLASQYSDDALTASIGGSLGFVSIRDIEPEFYEAVKTVTDKNVHTVSTRYGIHVFEVGNKDANGPQGTARYEIDHIFIKTKDYQEWVSGQKKNFVITKLL